MGAKTKRRKAPSPIEELDGPTAAQVANGDYGSVSMPNPDGGNRVAQVHINRGGTPVARWITESRLSDTQQLAIAHCLRLWRIAAKQPNVTAKYGERIVSGGDAEAHATDVLEARDKLWRIIDYFPGPLRTYWGVFEAVCRFNVPAGVAGGELTVTSRTADTRAHQVVCFVADYIAMQEKL